MVGGASRCAAPPHNAKMLHCPWAVCRHVSCAESTAAPGTAVASCFALLSAFFWPVLLLGAGSDMLAGLHFPLVVLDEAGQCTEPEALIAMSKVLERGGGGRIERMEESVRKTPWKGSSGWFCVLWYLINLININ
jgi:hypothetical protein